MALLLGCCLLRPAWADIYVYVDENGTTNLSNVPVDRRYGILVAGDNNGRTDSTLVKTGKVGPASREIARKAGYDRIVDKVAHAYGLESALLHAVITVESRYNPMALSKKGAAGLMQLMPATARRYGVADSFDPAQNVAGGAKYLRDLLVLFNNDVELTIAAYNAGENAVLKYGKSIPPFRETREYVPRVLGFYRKYQDSL